MYLHAEKQRHNSNFLHQTCVIIFAQDIKIFQVVAYLGKNVCNMPLILDIPKYFIHVTITAAIIAA